MKRVTKGIERDLTGILRQPRTAQTFWALVEPWYPTLVGLVARAERSARRINCDPREVVDHALIRAQRNWIGFRGNSGHQAWVWLRRYVGGSLLSFCPGRSVPRGDLSKAQESGNDVVAWVEALECLREAEAALSLGQKFVLRHLLDGKSVGDITLELGISPRAVRRRVACLKRCLVSRLLA